MKDFEVLIVGAGPAGSFAAERLARSGVRVALFDGRPEGEPKACGGGVTAKALKAWPHLLGAVGRTVDELEMYSPSGKRLHMKLDEPFAIYSRVAFDSYLRERGRAAGATVFFEKIAPRRIEQTETGWRLQSATGRQWSGKMLLAADGANSAIAGRLVGRLPNSEMGIAFGYRAPLPIVKKPSTVIAFLPGWPGYAWAFPRVDHVSFGIAISQNDFSHNPLDQLLQEFMIGYYSSPIEGGNIWQRDLLFDPSRAGLLESLKKSIEPYAARVPQLSAGNWLSRPVSGSNWALLGDAAGFVDPITDEGIYYALRSAELFAEAYIEEATDDYETRCRADFGRELRRAAKIRERFYGNLWRAPFSERMIDAASVNPGVNITLCKLIAGEQRYIGLKRDLARRALRIL